jgi:hypothetical protein
LRSRYFKKGRFFIYMALLLLLVPALLCSCTNSQTALDNTEENPSTEETEQIDETQAAEDTYPTVDWYDYRYTFMEAWRNRDLNPQSEVIDYGGDYVHLRVEITRIAEEGSGYKTPLQILLNSGGRDYRMFGKDYNKNSYLWRDYTDFPDEVGESHVYIVTMELLPYSKALNTSFSMQQSELVLNGMDWTNLESPNIIPLARIPLIQLASEETASP